MAVRGPRPRRARLGRDEVPALVRRRPREHHHQRLGRGPARRDQEGPQRPRRRAAPQATRRHGARAEGGPSQAGQDRQACGRPPRRHREGARAPRSHTPASDHHREGDLLPPRGQRVPRGPPRVRRPPAHQATREGLQEAAQEGALLSCGRTAPDPFARLQAEFSALPPVCARLRAAPEAAAGAAALFEACLLRGRLPRTTKELVALAVASLAGLVEWRDRLADMLAARGVSAEVLADVVRDGHSPRLPARTQRLIAVGRRAALSPATLSAREMGAARREGVAEEELVEVVALAGLLAWVVTVARALAAT
ncbi:MAG: hypothetical protein D6731_11955 [Planctomycetota bacterium]|nr:MAG: hypothetical protein D6731_11955 [Planctomycetota bacterium]